MPPGHASPEQELLQVIIGEQLSSVEFVQDYVQLRFDGPTLTAITRPVGRCGSESPLGRATIPGRTLPAHWWEVRATTVEPGTSGRVSFDDGSTIRVSLRQDDYRTAEAVKFDLADSRWWVL
ncbi:MAG: hypothetical protein ACREA0_06820 [bacterium]